MGKRWVNIELPYNTEETKRRCKLFKYYLRDNGIVFETSGAYENLHFDILCLSEQDAEINAALDRIVFYD